MNQPSGWGSARHARHGILFVEETVSSKKSSSGSIKTTQKKTEPVVLKDISLSSDERQSCEIGELDRVLGGGIVPGSLVL